MVDANQLLLARECGITDRLSYMLEDSLYAHNKGDLVLKILAFLQILWMFIQLGVRLGQNLPLTIPRVWISNGALHKDTMRWASLFALVLFGASHCAAWNFEFPTSLERLLWRSSSVLTAVGWLFAYLCFTNFG